MGGIKTLGMNPLTNLLNYSIAFLTVVNLVAFSRALPIDAGEFKYSVEVLVDKPISYYSVEKGAVNKALALFNGSKSKRPGPDWVYKEPLSIVAGPSGLQVNAVHFDGNTMVEIPHHPVFETEEIAVEFWFRSKQPFDKKFWPGSATLVTKATSGPGSGDWTILGGSLQEGVNEGRILVGVGPKGKSDYILASRKGLNDGRFHHVVWTRTAQGKNTLFVDGIVGATMQDSGGKISNNRPIQLGHEKREPGGSSFQGEVAALAIYNHPLTEVRVQAHFTLAQSGPKLPPPAGKKIDFTLDIKPIFQKHCHHCHGLTKIKGGFSLATRARAMAGGDNGSAIISGKSSSSPLVLLVAGVDEANSMPPNGKHLSSSQVGLIRAWIDQGASWPASADEIDPQAIKVSQHWSFKELKRPKLPTPKDVAWVKTPVDSFILAKQEEKGFTPAPFATKEAWLRRVYFDLIGLAPSPVEIQAFLNDSRPEAFSLIVDRLLDNKAYGERWARHWLDVVRYADSGGYETDIYYEQAWRYRDYVIRSFNEDKPYDQFLMEQVAGDELWPNQPETMQDAVAVWTLGEWQNALDAFPDELEYVRRTDQVVTFSEAMLGLTVGCANCHHHKYDPISQKDYFGLEAIFAASETWDKNTKQKQWIKGQRNAFRILRHAPTPTAIHLLTRGELSKPRGLVPPGLPGFLPGGGPLPGGADENKQRRSQLAKWLVSPQNPLTARVMANRIWQWHFSQALAPTPNDLGTQGLPPSHPELLDWLAAELQHHGWSLKKMHRLIVLSSTYQQSTVRNAHARAADPQNVYLSGFPRKRLEAEVVWDHLHATAGTLDKKPFGPPFAPFLSKEELQGVYDIGDGKNSKWPSSTEQNRRGIYILNRRSLRFPFFESFDPAGSGTSCPVRQTTTVPAQALSLINNKMVVEQAKAMALRLIRESGNDLEACVQQAWLLAYGRQADVLERQAALKFLSESELAHKDKRTPLPRTEALFEFCLGIINTTEFIYAN